MRAVTDEGERLSAALFTAQRIFRQPIPQASAAPTVGRRFLFAGQAEPGAPQQGMERRTIPARRNASHAEQSPALPDTLPEAGARAAEGVGPYMRDGRMIRFFNLSAERTPLFFFFQSSVFIFTAAPSVCCLAGDRQQTPPPEGEARGVCAFPPARGEAMSL